MSMVTEFEQQHATSRVVLISLAAAMGGFLFGFDTAVINGAVDAVRGSFGLDAARIGFAVSIALLGSALGAWYAGPVAELNAENERRARAGQSPMTSEEVAKFEFKGHHQHWSEALARHNELAKLKAREKGQDIPPGHEAVGAEGYLSPGRIQLFLCFYYIMTGIHGIHILVGIGCILWLVQQAYAGLIPRENYSTVEVVSLYWHLVDMIWLFLMPLLYLTGAGLANH